MNTYTIGAFAFYLIIILLIGFFFSRKTKNMGAYYLGDRSMNKWVVALSAQASDMSGWLLMGLPGAIYIRGLSEAWIGIGLGIGTYLNWKIVAKRLRIYSHHCGDSITIPDFFSNRFKDDTGLIRMISAVITLVFFTFYTASGFVACAKLFSTTFGMGYTTALILGVVMIVSYTLLGGFMAVCWTDVLQGTLMFFGILAVPLICIHNAGGFTASIETLNTINVNLLNLFTSAKTGEAVTLIGIGSSLVWGLGYLGMPHILTRFMAIDSSDNITESRRIAMVWVVFSLIAAVGVGLVGHLHVARNGIAVDDPEKIFMLLVRGLFHPVVAGIVLSAILAAIMSTADSQLLVAASAFCNDFYKKNFRKNAGNRELVLVSRVSVALVAIMAGVLAYKPDSDFVKMVMQLVSFAWGGFGSAFGPLMLLALFWRRANFLGAISGMIVGAATAIIWKFVLSGYASTYPIFGLYELAPGFLLSFVTIIMVSLLTAPPSREIMADFDAV